MKRNKEINLKVATKREAKFIELKEATEERILMNELQIEIDKNLLLFLDKSIEEENAP